jgi:DNA primase
MIAAEDPDHYLAVMSTQKRKGKFLDDYLRNGRGGRRGMHHATPTTTFAVARPYSR